MRTRRTEPSGADRAIKRNDYPCLDGLRGLAALIVLFGHSGAGLFGISLAGAEVYGVWLFFVLSAFLLTRLMARSMMGSFGPDDLLVYVQRRFLRIYPLFFTYLVGTVLVGRLLTWGFGIQPSFGFDLDAAAVIDHLALREARGVTWSIGVEIYYYVMLPFVAALFLSATTLSRLFGFCVFLVCVLGALAAWDGPAWGVEQVRFTSYVAVFLLGSYLGVLDARGLRDAPAIRAAAGQRGLAVAVAVAWALVVLSVPDVLSLVSGVEVSPHVFHGQPMFHALAWAVILAGSLYGPAALRRPFEHPLARYLGRISFGVYLLHPPVIAAVAWAGFGGSLLGLPIVLGVTVALAQLAHVAVERPFLRLPPRRPFAQLRRAPQAEG